MTQYKQRASSGERSVVGDQKVCGKYNGQLIHYSVQTFWNTNNGGISISAQDYDAWGYLLQGRKYESSESKFKFTSKERDNESTYDYFGARYYDSRIGRWGQVEPLLDAKLSLSPFTYCSDNPLTRIDMSGLDDIYYLEGNRKGKPTIIPTESPDRFFIEHLKGNISSNTEGLKGKGFFEVNDWQSLQVYFESKGDESIYESKDVVLNWSENGFNTRFEDAIPSSWDFFTPDDIYAANESLPGGNMDQKRFLSSSNLYVFGGIGYNNMEAGNIVWGAVMNYLHSGLLKTVTAANVYTRIAYGQDDQPNEQIAIEAGWKYFENSGKERRLTIYGK